jgi:hypothetical protein
VATYYDIFGQKVQYLSSDPSDVQVGQVWYNSTSNTAKFRGVGFGTGSWASGGNLPESKNGMGAFGVQTDAIAAGGYNGADVTASQSYDGTSWTATPSLSNQRRGLRGFGVSTAGAVAGGEHTSIIGNTEEYNGSSWTNGGTMPTAAYIYGTAGTLTAGIAFGGAPNPISATQLYDGTSWTTSPGSLPEGRYGLGGSGTQTAALAFGGASPPGSNTNTVSDWNGTAWSSNPHSMNTSRRDFGFAGSSQDGAIIMGGQEGSASAVTETYDGGSWTTESSMSTARAASAGAGSEGVSFAAGGSSPSLQNVTEEWTSPSVNVTKTITTS